MNEDKILGCLAGGAAGDALGYEVEFMGYSGITSRYGHPGIQRYALNANGVAEISDDTQMTLYTACGLLNASDCVVPEDCIRAAYVEWYGTQTQRYEAGAEHACWLSGQPEMYSRRAPGNTCMSALSNISAGMPVSNNSKGCGGIMRVAPIGLWAAVRGYADAEAFRLACQAAKLTHQHPLGYLPAGILAYAVKKIVETGTSSRQDIIRIARDGLALMRSLYGNESGKAVDEMERGTKHAIKLADDQISDISAISLLGEGWVGEEAWYIALYCVLKHIDCFEDAIVAAVNHSGDSDSTGSIAGNMMGAIHGYEAIPAHYKENLELLPVIKKISAQLANLS